MITEEFSYGNSSIHLLDPRVKIVIAVLFSLVAAVSSNISALLLSLLFSIFLITISGLKIKKVLHRLLIVNGFILVFWLFLPFTFSGEPSFSLGKFSVSLEGITYALLITIKSNAIILTAIALLATSSVSALVHALSRLYVPDKLIHLFFFCYRYIHVIHLEYIKLTNSMKIRCFEPKTNIRTFKTYAYLIGILLLKSYDRSERIYKAMLCRGFKGKFYVLNHFSIGKRDIYASMAMLLFVAFIAVLQWTRIIF